MARLSGRPPGTGGVGGGDGAFGTVLEQAGDDTKGLYIQHPQARVTWALRGTLRETEETAIRPFAIYQNVADSTRLTLTFGDAATDEKLFSPTRGVSFTPEQVNGFRFTHEEYPNPAALPAEYEVNDRLTVQAAAAGAGGNGHFVRMREGTAAVAATAAGIAHLAATDDDSPSIGNTLEIDPPTSDASSNGVEISVVRQVLLAAASLVLNNSGGNPAINVTFPNGAVHNGTRVQTKAPETVAAVAARVTDHVMNARVPTTHPINLQFHEAGASGNGFEVRFRANRSLANDTHRVTYISDTVLRVEISRSNTIDSVIASINAARRTIDGTATQLIVASRGTGTGSFSRVEFLAATDNTTATLGGGRDAATETIGATFWNPNTKLLTVAINVGANATVVTGYINADTDFPGTAAIVAGEALVGVPRQTSLAAAGGADASGSASGTVTWAPTGGQAGTGKLTIWTDGTLTVTEAKTAIDATSYDGVVVIFARLTRNLWTLNVQEYVFSGGVNGSARTPLVANEGQRSDSGTFFRRLNVNGVVPGVDTIADLIRVYEATRATSRTFAFVGTGTDFILTATAGGGAFVDNQRLAGGRSQLAKEAVHVQLTSASGAYRIRYYGANTPVALRSTIGELETAWRSIGGSQTVSPAITVTGDATEKVDPAVLPSSPSGGRDYTPPSVIELLVRGEDEVDGSNIEVRYDPARDTLQEILDALTAQGVLTPLVLPDTDLTAAPEAVPFSHNFYSRSGVTVDEIAYTLPGATETRLGGVRGATGAQANAVAGATILGWSVDRLRRVIDVAIPPELRARIRSQADIDKLTGISPGAEVNVVPSWMAPADSPRRVEDKPDIPAVYTDLTGEVPEASIPADIARDGEVSARINAALAGKWNDRGMWGSGQAYTIDNDIDVVRHDGDGAFAAYLAIANSGAGSAAVTEPGVGSQWMAHWYRIGYRDGPPNALVDAGYDADTGLWTFTREGGTNPLTVRDTPATPDPADFNAYLFYTRPALSYQSVPTSVAIPTTGAGITHTLLDQETITGGVVAGVDFVTEWFGGLAMVLDTNGTLIARMHTAHSFNGKSFRVTRERTRPSQRNRELDLDLSNFSSVTSLSLGTYTDAENNDIEITAEDLQSDVVITYELELFLRSGTGSRPSANVLSQLWQNPQVRSYQIDHAIGGAVSGNVVQPTINRFDVSGDQMPPAGSIAGQAYDYDLAVGQSSHAGSVRIVGFAGADANPTSVAVLATIAMADWPHATGRVSIPPGTMLAEDAVYTIRAEVRAAGRPLTASPTAYQDWRITARAPAAMIRFIRVPSRVGNPPARPTAANLIASSTVISTGGTAIASWVVSGIPDDNQDWLVGWIVPQTGAAQINHLTLGGINNDAALAARFVFTENSVDYFVYLLTDDAAGDENFNGVTIVVT